MKGDCDICANGKLPSDSATCVDCGLSRKNYKPMTNYARLISKTPEELAVICEDGCPPSLDWGCDKVEIIKDESVKEHCQRCWMAWLKSPADKEVEE